jgi:hypothetical protein
MCMIVDGYPYDIIAFELGNGIKSGNINNRWNRHLKKSTYIIKPQVPTGRRSIFTWAAEVDAQITRMIADGYSYDIIAFELGNGIKSGDIHNRWNQHLKKSTDIIKPQVPSCRHSITWTTLVDARITHMKADGYSNVKIAFELGNGLKKTASITGGHVA